MPDEAEDTIVVTAKKLSTGGATGGAIGHPTASATFSTQPMPDLFEQVGGDETVTTVTFAMIDGNVVVRLPGYDFPVKVPAAEWARMSNAQKGAFIKLMTEFSQSPQLVEFLDHLQREGVSEIEIHYDTRAHNLNGDTELFQPDGTPEQVQWQSIGSDETDLAFGTKVVISINSDLVYSPRELVELVIHALGHPFRGLSESDETWLQNRQDDIYNEIFSTPEERETSPQDYYEGSTIVGSRYGDNLAGGSANDTLSGLSGNDTLNGAGVTTW